MILKIKILATGLLLYMASPYSAQELNKETTIKYINTHYKEGVSVDSLGNITLGNKVRFSYRAVNLLEKTPNNKINLSCKNNESCIKITEKGSTQKQFVYTINTDSKSQYDRLYNALEHLLYLLTEEQPDANELDPFSPKNYKPKKKFN